MKSEDFDKKFLEIKKEILSGKNFDKNKYFEYEKIYKKIEDFATKNFEENDVENLKIFLQNFDEKNGNILTNNLARKEYEKKLKEFDIQGTILDKRKRENETLEKSLVDLREKVSNFSSEIDDLKLEKKSQEKTIENNSKKINEQNDEIKEKNNEIFQLQNLKKNLENDTEKIKEIKESQDYEKKLFDLAINNATNEEKKVIVDKVIKTMEKDDKIRLFKGLENEVNTEEIETEVLLDLKNGMKSTIYNNFIFMLNDLEFWYRKFIEEIMRKKYDNYAPVFDTALSSNERDENNVPILFDFLQGIVAKIRVFFLKPKSEDENEITKDVETLKKSALGRNKVR